MSSKLSISELNELAANTFLMWVDGVGGYLVCAAQTNVIGQASPAPEISIAIQGDLHSRHAQIEAIEGHHLLRFIDAHPDSGRQPAQPVWLRDQQVVELDGGVKLKYSQTHPLSSTARIDFVSRHRTQPWSDAVLLAGTTIILGPNRKNHVFCWDWANDLMLFRRDQNWFCRSDGPLEVDGQRFESEAPISLTSAISGEDFSLTLEPALGVG